MGFAFGHLVIAWLIGKSYEKLSKNKISNFVWVFLLFGSLVPDFDFILDWTLGTYLHRTFTHSFLFAIVFPTIVYFLLYNFKNKDKFAFAIGSGILIHLFVDILDAGIGIPIFWPNLLHISINNVGYIPANHIPALFAGGPELVQERLRNTIIDMALGTTWIFYLLLKKKLKF
jgi:membrane-bound metal-dependent hydrolase YbcI (DUF457 family)